MSLSDRVREAIRTIPDFPKPGIQFKDISTLLNKPDLMADITHWAYSSDQPAVERASGWLRFDVVVGLDARGFLFGVPVSLSARKPFVMCRKAGKLPGDCIAYKYDLEYGSASVEMQTDAFPSGSRVLLIDDLLATGGTMAAAVQLVRNLGGEVAECVFITELGFLDGRKKLEELDVPVRALVTY